MLKPKISRESACDCDGDDDEGTKSPPKSRKGYIPYSTIYARQDEVRKQGYWIPSLSVDATIVGVEKDTSSSYHILNPFLYTIELEHGKYKWRVVKRYKDFSYLSNRLLAHRAVERIKAPVRRVRHRIEEAIDIDDDNEKEKECCKVDGRDYEVKLLERSPEIEEGEAKRDPDEFDVADSGKQQQRPSIVTSDASEVGKRRDSMGGLPSFPMVPDAIISDAHMNDRKEKLQNWLQSVLAIPINRNYHETAEFLEVSRYSFINELGGKYKEGEVQKRPGGGKVSTSLVDCKQCCIKYLLPWGDRWLMVKDTYVCYMNQSNEQIRLVLLFDQQFEINSPQYATGIGPKELVLSNSQHVLHLRCAREEDTIDWIKTIKAVLADTGKVWLAEKPHGSSYPPRPPTNTYCQWFVDAKDYWDKASAMLEMARDEIFIAGWWLCPEIYLRRPMAEGNHWRLDYILKRQAEKGVHIFVLIYKEMEMALGLNSIYSKKHLQSLHPNIKVMRHPDHYIGSGTFFWAHHEKLLIIDQLIAFVGGVDLCYGRWDDHRHQLTDLGSVQFTPNSEKHTWEKGNRLATPDGGGGVCPMREVTEVKENIIEDGERVGERVTLTITPAPSLNGDATEDTPEVEKHPYTHRIREAVNKVMGGLSMDTRRRSLSGNSGPNKGDRSPLAATRSVGIGGGGTSGPADAGVLKGASAGPAVGGGGNEATATTTANNNQQQQPHNPPKVHFWTTATDRLRRLSSSSPAAAAESPQAIHGAPPAIGGGVETEDLHQARLAAIAKTMMEPKSRTMVRRVVSNLRGSKTKRRWRLPLEQENVAEEYVIKVRPVMPPQPPRLPRPPRPGRPRSGDGKELSPTDGGKN